MRLMEFGTLGVVGQVMSFVSQGNNLYAKALFILSESSFTIKSFPG